jgi:thiol:disulfide interchange protein DsbC
MRKYIVLACLPVIFLVFHPAVSPAFSGCETDCNKCHSLTNKEVKLILEKMKAHDAKILRIGMSPVKGLWEVDIENRGQRGLFYVDFSKKYLISGSVVEVNAVINKTRERLEELNKRVIVFTDPE